MTNESLGLGLGIAQLYQLVRTVVPELPKLFAFPIPLTPSVPFHTFHLQSLVPHALPFLPCCSTFPLLSVPICLLLLWILT